MINKLIGFLVYVIVLVVTRIACMFGYHAPAFMWYGSADENDYESICMACGKYLKGGKITNDLAVKKRIDDQV